MDLAERLRVTIERVPFFVEDNEIRITISLGVAEHNETAPTLKPWLPAPTRLCTLPNTKVATALFWVLKRYSSKINEQHVTAPSALASSSASTSSRLIPTPSNFALVFGKDDG